MLYETIKKFETIKNVSNKDRIELFKILVCSANLILEDLYDFSDINENKIDSIVLDIESAFSKISDIVN